MTRMAEHMWTEFRDAEYRRSYAESQLDATVATQIKLIREQRRLTQQQLAKLAGMKQSRISAMEDVDYSSWSLNTLKRLAAALDCALDVRFVPFSAVMRWSQDVSVARLSVPSFVEERANREKNTRTEEETAAAHS
jgi:predicted XRE-type DNA-binding protein